MAKMKKRFTVAYVNGLTCPAGKKRVMFHDADQPGLAVVVSETGRKVFTFYRWVAGRPHKQRLGPVGSMSIADARDRARDILSKAANGIAPAPSRSRALTVDDAWAKYLAAAKVHKKTWAGDQRRYDKHWAKLGPRKLGQVSREEVLAIYDRIGATAPIEANRCLAVIRAVYNHALDELGYDGPNPAARVPKKRMFREHVRERYLLPRELGPFFDALDGYRLPKMSDFFRLLLFTGVRRRQAERAAWADVDLDAATWRLRQTKAGREQTVHLTDEAVAVLRRRRAAVPASCAWVFPSRLGKGEKHLTEPMGAWREICKAAGLATGRGDDGKPLPDAIRVHDLRRTLATYMEEAGVSLNLIGETLGHTAETSVTQRYTHSRGQVIRAAVAKGIDIMLRHAGRLGEGLAARLA